MERNPFVTDIAQLSAIESHILASRLGEAAAGLQAFKTNNPADVRASLFEGLIARASKDTAREIVALQRAVAQAPRWARAHMELAMTLSREGRHGEALTAANTAVDLAPGEMPPLEAAVTIADAAGNPQVAERYLHSAYALWPGNIAISRALGISLTNLGRHAEAEAHWRALLAQHPDDQIALRNLGVALAGQGRKDEACELLEQALSRDPHNNVLRFHLAIARGETPPTQPQELVRGIFDGYASYFDRHLVGTLKYGVPRRMVEMIRTRQNGNLQMDVLDLGCGTGLIGVYLGRVAGAFIGVDVSPKMLQQAARHNVYTALRNTDLLEELRRVPAESFDYIVAADVFIYVGDVAQVIPACFRALRAGGVLIFSCETANEAEGALVLRPSKRYAHSHASLRALCEQAGFGKYQAETVDLRFEVDAPIPGFIAIAEKA